MRDTESVQRVKPNYLCNRCCAVSHASLMRAKKFFSEKDYTQYVLIWYEITRPAAVTVGSKWRPSRSRGQLKSVVWNDDKKDLISLYASLRRGHSSYPRNQSSSRNVTLGRSHGSIHMVPCYVDRYCDN